jgi:hypothetical protein
MQQLIDDRFSDPDFEDDGEAASDQSGSSVRVSVYRVNPESGPQLSSLGELPDPIREIVKHLAKKILSREKEENG